MPLAMIIKSFNIIYKKLQSIAIKFCIAGRFDANNVLILTSSPRSGSTLLGQVLATIPDSSILFEPLNLKKVSEAKALHFSWRTYVDPETEWIEGETFLRDVFEGKIINSWTSKEMSFSDAYKSTRLIVKFVRANRLLPWLCRTFDIPSPILLIRHPCAVIASQLKYGWTDFQQPNPPTYIDKYPLFRSALIKTKSNVEHLAASWALDLLPALLQKKIHPWIIVTYEELILHPEQTLSEIFKTWEITVDMDKAISKLKIPSSVVHKSGISGINGWRDQLTNKQISEIFHTVNAFGLTFYNQGNEADYNLLNSLQLPELIRKAGIE